MLKEENQHINKQKYSQMFEYLIPNQSKMLENMARRKKQVGSSDKLQKQERLGENGRGSIVSELP